MSNRRYVYVIGAVEGPVKIGVAVNLTSRLTSLQIGNPEELFVHHHFRTGYHLAQGIEAKAHRYFAGDWRRGEWFNITATAAKDVIERLVADAEGADALVPPKPGLMDLTPRSGHGVMQGAREAVSWYRTVMGEPGSHRMIEAVNAAIRKHAGEAGLLAFRSEIVLHMPLSNVLSRRPSELRAAHAALTKALNVLVQLYGLRRDEWMLDKIRQMAA